MRITTYFLSLSIVLFVSCKTADLRNYPFPKPVDTTSKPIELQEKRSYGLDGIVADNLFDGARMNNFEQTAVNAFRVTISPENQPINMSPYYAFRLWSSTARAIEIELNYTDGYHRYYPKISKDGKKWMDVDSTAVRLAKDSVNAFLKLNLLPQDTLWIAAQELRNSTWVKNWCTIKAKHPNTTFKVIGRSKLGRDLYHLDICKGDPEKKPTIVVISRQHPPEVTGYMAMESFVETILDDNPLSAQFLDKYRVLVFPLMNPDGVDLGHWRHNAGGIDLNRDWQYYHQEEPQKVGKYIVEELNRSKSKVVLGLDFHSTWRDVFYTRTPESQGIKGFHEAWIYGIGESFPDHEPENASSPLGNPIAASWFYTQFGAEGITYEVGDNTDRDFIRSKAKMAAIGVMQLLLYRE